MWLFGLLRALTRPDTPSTPATRFVNRVLFVLLIAMAITVYVLAKNRH